MGILAAFLRRMILLFFCNSDPPGVWVFAHLHMLLVEALKCSLPNGCFAEGPTCLVRLACWSHAEFPVFLAHGSSSHNTATVAVVYNTFAGQSAASSASSASLFCRGRRSLPRRCLSSLFWKKSWRKKSLELGLRSLFWKKAVKKNWGSCETGLGGEGGEAAPWRCPACCTAQRAGRAKRSRRTCLGR